MISDRIRQQFEFIKEIDALKSVYRQSFVISGYKRENDAEHSWTLAMLCIVLHEYAIESINLSKVLKMVLIHDIVEIDAGDTFAYDEEAIKTKRDREFKAADRIFNILPSDQAKEFRAIWDEFEEAKSPEARFATALDRIAPMFLNYSSGGLTWKEHKMDYPRIINKCKADIDNGTKNVWPFIEEFLQDGIKQGFIAPKACSPS